MAQTTSLMDNSFFRRGYDAAVLGHGIESAKIDCRPGAARDHWLLGFDYFHGRFQPSSRIDDAPSSHWSN